MTKKKKVEPDVDEMGDVEEKGKEEEDTTEEEDVKEEVVYQCIPWPSYKIVKGHMKAHFVNTLLVTSDIGIQKLVEENDAFGGAIRRMDNKPKVASIGIDVSHGPAGAKRLVEVTKVTDDVPEEAPDEGDPHGKEAGLSEGGGDAPDGWMRRVEEEAGAVKEMMASQELKRQGMGDIAGEVVKYRGPTDG